ncbi:cellulase family glycosylhydrolase [Inconstantimicrobium porci]|uniref:cellulase family glycosylhydrolase n=1 Tax=Inconstantimicrobium porci TaxID=2652291 RepID=UPI002408FE36|nr:cellulase family glycosylhydrolase [Inconstantimicrobium porci]MDD6769636.1 cellulase family glycosylhydrolase [Inconstantimicrobium porci]
MKILRRFLTLMALVVIMILNTSVCVLAADNNDDYLHTSGNKILDANNNEVRLTGIAWFGFETPDYVFHGLWEKSGMKAIINKIADCGFNLVRVPLSVEMINQWRKGSSTKPSSIDYNVNPELKGKSSEEVLDVAIDYFKKAGIKVMFDMHRIEAAGQKCTWYTDKYTTDDFEECWKYIINKYKNDDTVIAADLFNEPHGQGYYSEGFAKWDDSKDQNNWKYEAEKVSKVILDINPNLLVMVEGIESYPKEGCTYADKGMDQYYGGWWGGNLRGVKDHPIDLGSYKNKVVYAPHDYGPGVSNQPWFEKDFTVETLKKDVWGPNWLYIYDQNIAPILIGEWGGRLDGGKNEMWLNDMAKLIKDNKLNHTFWCVNPNSGDTGGIFKGDFITLEEEKYNIVKPTLWQTDEGKFIGLDHKINLGQNGTHIQTKEKIIKGDVDGNGVVDVSDLVKLRKYIMYNKKHVKVNEKNADVSDDGQVNMADLILLKGML